MMGEYNHSRMKFCDNIAYLSASMTRLTSGLWFDLEEVTERRVQVEANPNDQFLKLVPLLCVLDIFAYSLMCAAGGYSRREVDLVTVSGPVDPWTMSRLDFHARRGLASSVQRLQWLWVQSRWVWYGKTVHHLSAHNLGWDVLAIPDRSPAPFDDLFKSEAA